MDEHHVVLGDGVLMNLYRVLAILFHIALLYCLAGKLARFAAHHDTCAKLCRHDTGKHESARLYAHDFRYTLVTVHVDNLVAHDAQTLGVLEESGDILKLNARLREIRNTSEVF